MYSLTIICIEPDDCVCERDTRKCADSSPGTISCSRHNYPLKDTLIILISRGGGMKPSNLPHLVELGLEPNHWDSRSRDLNYATAFLAYSLLPLNRKRKYFLSKNYFEGNILFLVVIYRLKYTQNIFYIQKHVKCLIVQMGKYGGQKGFAV